jgi:cytochrome c6
MRRSVKVLVLGLLAAAGVAAGVFASGGGAAPVHKNSEQIKLYKVTVKASEFKYVLSKRSIPAPGKVIFTLLNKGKIAHDFKIAGKKTPTIQPGKSAKLIVVFKKKGQYVFLCTLPGHAKAGMKGKFAVAVKPVVTPTTTTPTTTTPTTPTTTTPTTPSGPEQLLGDPVAGAAVFKANGCGSCHTLAAAGSTGTVGPNLDNAKPSQARVIQIVPTGAEAGGAAMPAFNISGANLNNLAAYVYASTH